jgi:hypothetical protein
MALGKIKADTLEHSTAGSLDTKFVVNGSAKAWVFATNAAVLNDSLNVSSGTDHGSGDYSYALTNAFSDENYANAWTNRGTTAQIATRNSGRDAAGTLAMEAFNSSGTNTNNQNSGIAHGDLA